MLRDGRMAVAGGWADEKCRLMTGLSSGCLRATPVCGSDGIRGNRMADEQVSRISVEEVRRRQAHGERIVLVEMRSRIDYA